MEQEGGGAENMSKHFDAIAHRKDGSFALCGSSLTGSIWDGSLWLFKDWEQYTTCPNLELDSFPTITGSSDIAWLSQSKLVVAADSGDLEIWEVVAPGNALSNSSGLSGGHDDMVLTVCVTRVKEEDEEGESIISGGGDGCIAVWDINTTKLIRRYRGHVGWITDIDHHPTQSSVFISTGMDKSLKIWDTRQSSPVTMSFTAPRHSSCLSVSWSKFEDNLIASGDEAGYLHLHDLRLPPNSSPSTCPFYYKLHSNSVHRLSFSPSIKGLIASASDDSTAKLFHFPSQTTVFTSSSHADFVHGLSWHLDSTSFLTCGWDGKVFRHEFHESLLPKEPVPLVVPLTTSEMQDESLYEDLKSEDEEHQMEEEERRREEETEERDNIEEAADGSTKGKRLVVETVSGNGGIA